MNNWVQKYRPKNIDDCVIVDSLRDRFNRFIERQNFPHLLFYGDAGTGKTSVAKAILKTIDADYLEINGSLDNGIDVLREVIEPFASAYSLYGKRKYVLLDEADGLSHKVQPALRNFMEKYANNCGFILTCNFADKIIQPLHSRCSVINFNIPKNQREIVRNSFNQRIENILEIEGVDYEKNEVNKIVKEYFPDFRRTLNELESLYC